MTSTKKKRVARKAVVSPSIEPVHGWFGLTYANYLVLSRAVLQSMPLEWQEKFVKLLGEANAACRRAGIPAPHGYRVQPVDVAGRYAKDEILHYKRAPNLFTAVEHAVLPSGQRF